MRAGTALALALLAAGPAFAARESLGVFEAWGAFRDDRPARCYAIARAVRGGSDGRGRAFASIATWPGRGLANQVHVRLSRPRDARAAVTLSTGDRRFELTARATDAWAPDARADAAIVGAMRAGRSMSVESVADTGRPFVDVYGLRGAATAIDAAALACAGRR